MGVEHLAILERLRKSQRQDYLKVCICFDVAPMICFIFFLIEFYSNNGLILFLARFCIGVSASYRSSYEGTT